VDGFETAFDGFGGIFARFGLPPSRLAFTAFDLAASRGLKAIKSRQKPQKAIKKPLAGFLM